MFLRIGFFAGDNLVSLGYDAMSLVSAPCIDAAQSVLGLDCP